MQQDTERSWRASQSYTRPKEYGAGECRVCSVRGRHSNGARLRAMPIWLDGFHARASACLGAHRYTHTDSNGPAGTQPMSGTNTTSHSAQPPRTILILWHKGKKKMKKKKKERKSLLSSNKTIKTKR